MTDGNGNGGDGKGQDKDAEQGETEMDAGVEEKGGVHVPAAGLSGGPEGERAAGDESVGSIGDGGR